jgi:hypothetical protein
MNNNIKIAAIAVVLAGLGFLGFEYHSDVKSAIAPKASVATTTFTPGFDNDDRTCDKDPIISDNSVAFGDSTTSCAGRVVSKQGYKNITQIRATADFSKLSSNFVTNTFYMINNPNNPGLQPKGTNYCDAGGNNAGWNCQEVDFFEANKNVVFQHTMHIGDGSGSAPQNYQFSYSTTTDSCYVNLNPTTGLVSWNGIDKSKPVDIIIDLDDNGMTVTFAQGTIKTVVYKMGAGYSGSTTFSADQLARWQQSRAEGYWLNVSMWQSMSWSPGAPQGFYNWSCPYGQLCTGTNPSSYFKVYNVEVDAEGTI